MICYKGLTLLGYERGRRGREPLKDNCVEKSAKRFNAGSSSFESETSRAEARLEGYVRRAKEDVS
ncbi:unnamed protein product [Clonostachys rhizophaga]|uniref:Uncharacterized protein n=1 Tax=Clonostachys rhizophaga TaxID=160324 RepID=A0A9N9VKE4_9HYPO|nr:unnamed protein product [Clonostachys rhizophaga]